MKIVVGFENENRIERFNVVRLDGDVAIGTLGADPTEIRLRPVPCRSADFDHRMLVAAGGDQYNAVELA